MVALAHRRSPRRTPRRPLWRARRASICRALRAGIAR